MSLQVYYQENFSVDADLDPVDTFTGTGVDVTFTLVKKVGADLASTITADNLQYYQFNGGFTKSGDSFTLSSAPILNSQIVAPGLVALTFDVFDQDIVDGVTNPRVQEIPFYLGDPTTIHLKSYTNLPQFTGIKLTVLDLISGAGLDLSCIQLACSDGTTGLAMTYAATGEPIYTAALQAFGTLSASSAVGASSISTSSTSNLYVGDYVIINIGQPTQEIRKVKDLTSTKIGFFTNLEYAHTSGQSWFQMGRKFWGKFTAPLNAANNQAFTFREHGLERKARINSKV